MLALAEQKFCPYIIFRIYFYNIKEEKL